MASKRKKKNDAVASSSSENFDRQRFWDATAASNYTDLMNKGMHRERGINMTRPTLPLITHARDIGWENFITPPSYAVISLVREFYANLMVKHKKFRVRVRGRMVAFDSKTINAVYSMPDIDEDEHTTFLGGAVDYEEILRILCNPGAVWNINNDRTLVNFKANFLKYDTMVWFLFVTSRIMPSSHETEVTKERAALVYSIVTGKTVDIGKLVQASILHAASGTSTLSMPHSSLITDLCKHAGVTWDKTEESLKTRVPIDVYSRLAKSVRRAISNGEVGEASGSGQPQQGPQGRQRASEHPARARTINQRLDALENKVDNLYNNIASFMTFVGDFTTALAQRFPDPNQEFTPFPQPPTWNYHDAGEEDDNDEADDGGNEY